MYIYDEPKKLYTKEDILGTDLDGIIVQDGNTIEIVPFDYFHKTYGSKKPKIKPVYEGVCGGEARQIGWEDEDGNQWETVCGGPPRSISKVRIGG